MMFSDVIIDTVPCLPYRPSSRPRHGIISYRIPDDTATQSITYDIGYDNTQVPPRPSPRHISSPYLLPAPLPAEPCRQTCRLETRRHPVRYSPRLPVSPACHHLPAPSHRLIRSARCFPALSAARRRSSASRPMRLIHLIRSRPISSAHLPSRHASRSASRRASRLASPRLTSRHVSSTLLANLIRLVHLIHLIRLIANAPSDKTSDEQAKRRTRRAIDNEARRIPQRSIPQMPIPARRIAPTSRITHDPDTNTPTGKRPLYAPHNASDGQHETRGRDDDGTPLIARLLTDKTTRRRRLLASPTRATERLTTRRLLPAPRHEERDERRDEKAGREAG